MTNNLDNFEQLIKDSFEGYEVPYNPSHWQELKQELSSGAGGSAFHYFSSVATGMVITFVIIASIFLLMPGDSEPYGNQISQAVVPEDNSEATGDNKIATPEAVTLIADSTVDPSAANEPESTELQPEQKSDIVPGKANVKSTDAGKGKSAVAVSAVKKEVAPKSTLKTGCVGLTVEFSSEGQAKDANFLWNFGDGYFSSSANPVHTYTRPGQFDVSLSVTSKSSGQISSNVVQGSIVIVEAPVANFRTELQSASRMQLVNHSSNADHIHWQVNNTPADKTVVVDLSEDKLYNILLVADNENGCTDSLSQTVEVINTGTQSGSEGSFIPEFFTSAETGTVIFKVFDESGKNVLYESNSHTLPWVYDKRQKLNNPWVLISKQPETGDVKVYTGKVISK